MSAEEDACPKHRHKMEALRPPQRHLVTLDAIFNNGLQNIQHSSVSFSAREVIILFQCVGCKDTPLSPPVHICPAGHQSCHQCYTSYNIACLFCHQSFIGRNETLEFVIQNMHPMTALKLSHLTTKKNNPLKDDIEQYDPILLDKLERALYKSIRNATLANVGAVASRTTETETEPSSEQSSSITVDISLATNTSTSVDVFRVPPLHSWAPVTCPIQTCDCVVRCSTFVNHIELQHLMIPKIAADYNTVKCIIAVNPMRFKDSSVECPAIFLVPNELPMSPSVAKIVMGNEDRIIGQIRQNERWLLCLVMAAKFTNSSTGSEGDGGETFFLAWTACLYEKPPIYYTIKAANNTEMLCFEYCGPVGTLCESQDPSDVFRRGNSLVISPGQLKMLSNPTGNVEISIIFHPVSI